jgi:hypothetical protein
MVLNFVYVINCSFLDVDGQEYFANEDGDGAALWSA